MTLAFEQHRAINDLLIAERQLREQSEKHVQELHQLILETAIRLDGERFESIRRSDPSVPRAWNVSQWRSFLREIPTAKGWGASIVPSDTATHREQELLQQVEALRSQLDESFQQLDEERKRSQAVSNTLAEINVINKKLSTSVVTVPGADVEEKAKLEIPAGTIPMQAYILEDVRSIMKSLPKRPPAPFDKVLDGGNRVGGDLIRVYQRYWMAVYLVGKWMLCASMEIEDVIAKMDDVSSKSGSLKRIMDDLIKAGIFINQKLETESPKTALVVNQLSGAGLQLYQELFKETALENENLVVQQVHNNAVDKCLAILLFTMHARKCGWMTRIMPAMQVDAQMKPDVWIANGNQSHYVKVELGRPESSSIWRDVSNLNNGVVAICTSTSDARQRLVGDCRLDKIGGVATDIETLVKMKYKVLNNSTSLWAEEW
jgi:hypothetical protein